MNATYFYVSFTPSSCSVLLVNVCVIVAVCSLENHKILKPGFINLRTVSSILTMLIGSSAREFLNPVVPFTWHLNII